MRRHEDGDDHHGHLVGDRIEHRAQLRHLVQAPREEAVHPVADGGDYEDGNGPRVVVAK